MPLDQEPPDGDYAAYIDRLVNGRQGSPGAVAKPISRGKRRLSGVLRSEEPASSSGHVPRGDSSPGEASSGDALLREGPLPARHPRAAVPPAVIRRDHNGHTEFEYASPDGDPGKADSLGPHGSPRLAGIVQIILGLGALALFARVAILMTYSHDPFSLDHIVPLVLLGFIARMFLARGNAKLREARSRSRHGAAGPTRIRRQRRAPLP